MSSDSSDQISQQRRRARRYWHFALIIVVATTLNFVRLMQAEPLQSANDRSRWATVWSLVERGTFRIDEIRRRPGWDTIDRVLHAEPADEGGEPENHFYSSKPPVLSTVVAGLSWIVTHTLGWTLDDDLLATTRLLLLFVNLIPMTIALVVLALLVDTYAVSDFTRYFLVIAAATATLLQPFLVVLNNHTPAAISCVLTLAAVIPLLNKQCDRGWVYAAAGFWAACTCCLELPAAVFGVAVFLLLASRDLWRTLLWFVPAALVPLAGFFVTNYLVTGGWKPFYLYYGTEKYVYVHDGVPSYWMFPRGIDRAKDGTFTYLLHCLVGHHGIFSLTPVYLLTLVGWLNRRTWDKSPLRTIHALGLFLTVAMLCFFLTKTENYNYGGVSVALRWTLWLTPFWLLAAVPALDSWRPETRGRSLCALLLAVSVFSAWYPFGGPWEHPWLFKLMEQVGWIDYSDPQPQAPKFSTWIRQLPPSDRPDRDPDYWIEFEGVGSDGRIERLTLADAGGVADAPFVRRIEVTRAVVLGDGRTPESEQWILAVDVDEFNEGRPPEDIIAWSEVESPLTRDEVVSFLRGLPNERDYQPGRIRYLDVLVEEVKSADVQATDVQRDQPAPSQERPMRTEDYQCLHAASRVRHEIAGRADPVIYRRDLWLTDNVPFGILMFEITIHDLKTETMLSRQRMQAVRAGHVEPFDELRLRRIP